MAYLPTWKPYKINQILGKYTIRSHGSVMGIIASLSIPYVSVCVGGITQPQRTKGTSPQSCWGLRVHRTNWPIGRENPRPRGTPRFPTHPMVAFWEPRKRWAWWHIIPQLVGKMPLLYSTYIYILPSWVIISYLPPFMGTRNHHWPQVLLWKRLGSVDGWERITAILQNKRLVSQSMNDKPQVLYTPKVFERNCHVNTVDGRNPAPPGMVKTL